MTEVTIDVDDTAQVQRIVDYLDQECDWFGMDEDNTVPQLQDALRSLVAPPKPPEPDGLGAVVECDYDGKHGKAVYTGAGWTFYGQGLVDHSAEWWAFDNVVVLSEGVA